MVINWPPGAIILHIPHASTVLPSEVNFLLGYEALAYEVDAMTDHHTDRLFDLPEARRCVFPVSRLVVDPERFIQDPMESVGMGVVYTRTADGVALRAISDVDRLSLINTYYNPHHAALTRMVDEHLEQHGQCLIIDCHSFPAQPLPYEKDHHRPDICIGTDPFHTDQALIRTMVETFETLGYAVAVNSPFSGTIVPLKHYHKDQRVASVMIEVNRSLYANPTDFSILQSVLTTVMNKAAGLATDKHRSATGEDQIDFSELEEIIRLAFREQANHPQGLNSSHTHGTLYPAGDPRNNDTFLKDEVQADPVIGTSKPLRVGSRRNWI
jgi:N-formylglutamate amidohydrolase